MRVLVTGATGFIGRHLCRALAERGDEVTALVRSPSKAAVLPEATTLLQGDLTLFADPDCALAPQDIVIHLAGVVASNDPDAYEAINYTAVADLLRCLESQPWQPSRVLFASSMAAAGPSRPGRPWTEQDPPAPTDPYGDAKARAEILCRESPLPVTIVRPPAVFGPEDSATLTLYKAAEWGLGMGLWGASQRISWVDVRDLVTAIITLSDDPREGDHCYFASHPDSVDTDELWQALGEAVGRRVRVVPMPVWVLWSLVPFAALYAKLTGTIHQLDAKQVRQITVPCYECSSAALSKDLGWRAQHSLRDATRNAVDGYRTAGMLGRG